MSETIKVRRINSAFLKVNADHGVMREIWDHFSFMYPGHQHMKSFKTGSWDGWFRLFDVVKGRLYVGLYEALCEFAKISNYTIELEPDPNWGFPGKMTDIAMSEMADFVESLNLHSRQERIAPREYQLKALYTGITEANTFIISPTSSGKSLIIYMLLRWMQKCTDEKIVLIVPTTALVDQMFTDFMDYSEFDDDWYASDNCHCVYSGKDKISHQQIMITTWQSLATLPKGVLKYIGGVVGDEAHTFKAKSLTTMMEGMTAAKWRIGTTGTTDGTEVNEMVLEGLFGPFCKYVSTKELMDAGTISDMEIFMGVLKYSDDSKKMVSKVSWDKEIAWICDHEKRNNTIANLALNMSGNTLVMYRYKRHGKDLYDLIKASAHKNRKVFLISGETKTEVRNKIRPIVEAEKDAIIVASVGVFSTGVNIKNLHNLIFGCPMKSQIKVLQSIGRVLRKSEDGSPATVVDICDDLSWKSKTNTTLTHAAERLKVYNREGFKVSVHEIEIGE